jgi:hypothetical protein
MTSSLVNRLSRSQSKAPHEAAVGKLLFSERRTQDTEQAWIYVEQYEALAERSSRRNRAGAARCRGLLAAAEGDLEGAFVAFDRSLREHEGLAYPSERARTLLALGQVGRGRPVS